jgi:hypothetical protein
MFDNNSVSYEKLEQRIGEIPMVNTTMSMSENHHSSRDYQQSYHLHGQSHHLHQPRHTLKPLVLNSSQLQQQQQQLQQHQNNPMQLPSIQQHLQSSEDSSYPPMLSSSSYPLPYGSSPKMLQSHSMRQESPQVLHSKHNSHSSKGNTGPPHIEYLNDGPSVWIVQWFNEDERKKWKLGIPQFKYCKKRKDHFSDEFPETWYKAPYKYHMSLDVANMGDANVMACIDLNYEDGQKVVLYNNGPGSQNTSPVVSKPDRVGKDKNSVITNNESSFTFGNVNGGTDNVPIQSDPTSNISTVTIGPFSFNICSYKQDGRKFRMVIYLYESKNDGANITDPSNGSASLCCCLISPSFTIRAKKPIAKPGSKKKESEVGKKRKEEENDSELPVKKLKSEQEMNLPLDLAVSPIPPHRSSTLPNNLLSNTSASSTQSTELPNEVVEALLQGLDEEELAKMVGKSEEKNPERIGYIVNLFQKMNDQERKILLCRLIESCLPHEKEFIFQKYFGSNSLDSINFEQRGGNSSYTTSSSSSNPSTNGQSYVYGKYITREHLQAIQRHQQELYDYFAMINNNNNSSNSGANTTAVNYSNNMQTTMMTPNTVTTSMQYANDSLVPTATHMTSLAATDAAQVPSTSSTAVQNVTTPPSNQQRRGQQRGQSNEVEALFTQLFD